MTTNINLLEQAINMLGMALGGCKNTLEFILECKSSDLVRGACKDRIRMIEEVMSFIQGEQTND